MKLWIKRTLFGALGATLLVGGLTACGNHDRSFGSNMSAEQYAQKRDKIVDKAASKLDLTDEERDLVRRRDWRGLIHYGCIFFGLEKLGAVLGVSNLHIYAAMRGQPLADFMKTRNAPNALYSVAATDSGKKDW